MGRWLLPEERRSRPVVEEVVCEGFLWALPSLTAEWVTCHRPASLEGQSTSLRTTWHSHHKPEARVTRPHLLIPTGTGARWVEQTPRHLPKTPSRTVAPTRMGVTDPAPSWPRVPGHPRGAPQMPGPECGFCGRLGHNRHECTVMEVGQVVQIAAVSASALDPDGRDQIPVKVQGDIHQALVTILYTAPSTR